MSADIERHDFQPGPRADRCADCYQPAGHAIHGGRRPPDCRDRRAEAAEDFHRRAVADYDPLPERWHIAGEQPAASDGDGGRSYGAAVAHQAAKQHSATGVCTLAPDRPHAYVGVCTACVEQGLFETITVTPSPEMRSAVLAAAGLTDDLDDGGDDVTDALGAHADDQECSRCTDTVHYLSSQGLCDGCEAELDAAPADRTAEVRMHSSDDIPDGIMEPVAVILRADGSVDAYGYIAVIDQRAAPQTGGA